MTSPILFAGGEDIDFTFIGGNFQATVGAQYGLDSTAGHFRAGYARYGIGCSFLPTGTAIYARTQSFASGNFWTSARNWSTFTGNGVATQNVIRWLDSSGIQRLRIQLTSSNYPTTINLQKINAAGTITTLLTSTATYGTNAPSVPDKIDVFINYAVSGTFVVYYNGGLIASYSGDVTTDSQTSLSFVDFGSVGTNASGTNVNQTTWSEIIVATSDTRNFSLVTQAPSAFGNTHTWTSGTSSNISATLSSTGQSAPNFSTTAGQIQEFQVSQAIPSGSFSVISVVQSAQLTIGSAGPGNVNLMIRANGVDFDSNVSITPITAWSSFRRNWDVNPSTNVAWQSTDFVINSNTFNMGLKSVT